MRATERGRYAPAPVTCSDRQGTCFRKIWGLGIQLYGENIGKGVHGYGHEGRIAGVRAEFHATRLQIHRIKRGYKALLDVCEAISAPHSVNPGTASSVGRDSRLVGATAAWRRMESPVCRRRSSDVRLLRHRLAMKYFLSHRRSFVCGPTFWRDGR